MEEKTTTSITEEDRQALKHHRIANALATLQNVEDRNAPKKMRSKKKRRAREKKARVSRKINR